MEQWPIFDNDTGFGGDGVPGTYTLPPDPDNIGATASPSPEMLPPALVYKGCVQDGPFANLTLHLGPGKLITERCLVRGFHPLWRRQLDSAAVNRVLASNNFEEFRVNIDQGKSGLHGGGHPIVGGEMSNLYSAAGGAYMYPCALHFYLTSMHVLFLDPIFYTHHGNLDRMWWLWQRADPERRMYDVSGPASRNPDSTEQTTLDYELVYPGSGQSVKIRDIMDTSREPNCFTYEP